MASSITSSLSRLSLFRFASKHSSPSFHSFPTINPKVSNRSRFTSSSMASESKESPSNNPGLVATPDEATEESPSNNPGLDATPDEATKGYLMQQTMFRIKDPKVSLEFYSRILGMSLLKRLDFPEMKFSLYFMGYEDPASAPSNSVERTVWTFGRKATIELTHNWGTENDPDFKGYHNGNSEPRGFGHIGITVDDTYKACERFERLQVEFVKKPNDGKWEDATYMASKDFKKRRLSSSNEILILRTFHFSACILSLHLMLFR
ncbi:hypothetical protein F0562_022138 [Nyssa sinensis]|uniref:Lactoylglutathione lyase n=1 Tax=Nyssa sinensis TaxID=561372 RepID=A0A5J5BN75_9ASTE|nr:hypothetical protein F0562_022138 [Nyssa sinensis]